MDPFRPQEQTPDPTGRRRFRRSPPAAGAAGTSRRAFLRSTGGYATGAAAAVGVPAALLLDPPGADAATAAKTVPNPTSRIPASPVMAYVHDAKAGTVVIMSGTKERTVKDHDLVQRLLHAPVKKKARRRLPRTSSDQQGG